MSLLNFAILALLVAFVSAEYRFQDIAPNESVPPKTTCGLQRCAREVAPESCGSDEALGHCCSGVRSRPEEIDHLKNAKLACEDAVLGDKAQDYRCDKGDVTHRELVCVGDCLAKKFHLLTEDGRLRRDAVLNHTRAIVGDIEWKQKVVDEYVGSCLDEVATIRAEDVRDGACNGLLLKFHQCNWKKFVLGCPADLQIPSQRCIAIRHALKSRE